MIYVVRTVHTFEMNSLSEPEEQKTTLDGSDQKSNFSTRALKLCGPSHGNIHIWSNVKGHASKQSLDEVKQIIWVHERSNKQGPHYVSISHRLMRWSPPYLYIVNMGIEFPAQPKPLRAEELQLHSELQSAVTMAISHRRPILHHLNADSSWLLQIPRPSNAVKHGGRLYYNILIDPWLKGPQADVASWFSQQWHATESRFGSIAEVEELAEETEKLGNDERSTRARGIDVVAISHEFTDHCHRETLLQVHRDIPVVATKVYWAMMKHSNNSNNLLQKAAELISSWSHFRTVLKAPTFTGSSPDWRETSLNPLPTWIGISRITSSSDKLYYHSALLISFNSFAGELHSSDSNVSDAAEAVIYTPHGVKASSLSIISEASPPLSVLAFLHGLHDIAISSAQQLNLGGHNGLAAQRILKARYWIGTHDEQKRGGGLVSFFLRRKIVKLEDALEEERRRRKEPRNGKTRGATNATDGHDEGLNAILEEFEDARFAELANGESQVLE